MQRRGQLRSFAASAAIIYAVFALTGCLPAEKGEATFNGDPNGPPGSGNSRPTIAGNPGAAVSIGDMYSFSPNAADPDGDTLSFSIENQPSWANFDQATGRLWGQPSLGDIGDYNSIRITVSDGQATASTNRFTISVIQVGTLSTTLHWNAPTENEDGSALTDLAGFRIYWGRTAGMYTHSVTIDNPGITMYMVENLAPGNYEFVARAYDASGVESTYSNIVTMVLQ